MLQDFRDNLKGSAKIVLVAIIIVPFALFGVDAIFLSGSSVEEVASVNGETITELRLQQSVALQKQQILNRYEDLDPSMINDEQLRGPVMQQLIRQKAVELAAREQGMAIDDKMIYRLLLEVPDFQVEGKFDAQRYEFVLRQMGYTPNSYNKLLRADMLNSQFMQGVSNTGFSTERENQLLASITEQTRDFYYLTIPRAPVLEAISITDEEIQSFYESNTDQFMADEQLVVEYIELRPDDLVQEVVVEENVVNDVIEARINAARIKQSRQVAQILLEKQDDGSHLDKISDIQQQLEAGEDFAVLAEQYSEDYSTAEQGGDLGFVQRGDLPESLSVALDSLSVGEVSDLVETDLGVHLVKLLAEKKAELPSRDDIEPGIRRELQRQLALELLPERIEELKDLSYNASSLESVADRLDLTLQVTEPFSRNGGEGLAGKPQVITAAFSEPVLEKGLTSEVLDLADDHVVVLSLRERIPSRLKPLAEVRPRIEQILKKERADRQLMERAETLVARVKGGESIEDVAKQESLQWQVNLDTKRFSGKLNEEIRQWVFSLAEPADSAVVSDLALANGDHVVVSLTRVTEGDFNKLSAEQKQVLSTTVALTAASRDYQAYETLLVEQADITSKY
ncbi:SurA N-terminal domain-containing protein [Porticoccus sp.]|uniref:SurA N-terminal domain-containing protein n=1 Tax=Porticoccus sp. TaxID=2024853 RepID=UPI000C44DF36|nr:SurA N-terminal domain-containing protein [Porticoccus sp.]MAZ70297.1 hypothetical protein [Porticoccus sp.]|tara:strand:+ start:13968 stop:15845 length:1878 start_codon:yes stop_codon:yes gene_type:complete